MKKIIAILLIIGLIGASLGIYFWQNKKQYAPVSAPLDNFAPSMQGPTAPPSISEPTSPQPE